MNLFLKRVLYLLIFVAIGTFLYSYFNDGIFNKRLIPQKIVSFQVEDLKLKVFYNRPSKRNRVIFGALVPYDLVWRTGANEATTFETNKPLKIGSKRLEPGKYTLWTIPNDTAWTVIFNSKMYPWGVDETMQPMRNPDFDVIKYKAPVKKIDKIVEQFTIAFDNSTDNLILTMAWDQTKIEVPLK